MEAAEHPEARNELIGTPDSLASTFADSATAEMHVGEELPRLQRPHGIWYAYGMQFPTPPDVQTLTGMNVPVQLQRDH